MNKEIIETYTYRNFIDIMESKVDKKQHSRQYSDTSYCKETFENALKNAKYGFKQQKQIQKIITNMSLLENIKTKCFGMDVTGLCVDIGAYLNGEPECFISEQFEYQPKKVVKLLINMTYSHGKKSEQIQNRGAGIISLIQMLKKQGYIVKINLYISAKDSWMMPNNKRTNYKLFIKIPNNPLDIQSLSYALCGVGFLRRFFLAWKELKDETLECKDYGCVQKLDEVAISKDIIHFEGLDYEKCKYYDEDTTKNFILGIFNDFLKLNNEVANEKNYY